MLYYLAKAMFLLSYLALVSNILIGWFDPNTFIYIMHQLWMR